MKHFRYGFSLVIPFLVLILAACGNSTTKPSDTYTAPTSTTTAATGTTIHTASATVKGKTVTLLTTAEGWTLYYFTPDTATTSACTTAPCNTTWPALISKDTPTSNATLSGTLGLQTNANGSQATYNGHPLYTYSKDTAAGQTNGEGVGGKWFVATTDLPTIGGTTVHTASATVKGKTVTLLTNAEGWTLYYFTPDTATTSACTTAPCNTTWPAFIAKGTPTSTDSLSGTLGVQTNANGSQVTYNGHPLYTYSKDTAAGQTNGEGVGGKWFVATTDLPKIAGGNTTPTPAGSGYNY
jgi:predicted lipoprotein with Yx(FWY)xxD motif